MNKRSAMLMAAGLVLTMLVAGVAIMADLTGPSASAAIPATVHHRAPKPIVKTIRTTRTVHRTAPQGQAVATFARVMPTTAAPATFTGSAGYGDGHEGATDDAHLGGAGDD